MKADFECWIGVKQVNDFMRSCNMPGAFIKQILEVDWKPDEAIDKTRAELLCEPIKQAFLKSGVDCVQVRPLALYEYKAP